MNLNETSMEAMLQNSLNAKNLSVDPVHFYSTLEQAKIEQQKRMVKQDKCNIQMAVIMAKHGGKQFALAQAILLALCLVMLSKYFGDSTISIYSLDTAIGAMSILTLLSVVPYLKRAKATKMKELEIASCASPSTLILARLMPMLFSQFGVLLGIILFSVSNFDAPTERVLLSALLPYLTVSTLSGLLLIWTDGEHFTEICLAVCTVVFCILLIRKELLPFAILEASLLPGFLLCVVLALISLLQMKQLVKLMVFQNEVI